MIRECSVGDRFAIGDDTVWIEAVANGRHVQFNAGGSQIVCAEGRMVEVGGKCVVVVKAGTRAGAGKVTLEIEE